METKITIQAEDALAKSKSIAEKKFEVAIQESASIVAQCKSITITSTTELAMSEQAISRATKMMKMTDEKRKEIIKPAKDFTDMVNGLVKSKITTPLEEAIAYGKDKLREWNEAEKLRAAQAEAETLKKYEYLKTIETQLNKKVELCDSPEKCQALIVSINEKWPQDEAFGQYIQEANKTRSNFIYYLTTRGQALKAALEGGANAIALVAEMNVEQVAVLINQKEVDEALEEKKDILSDNIFTSKSKVRRIAKFEVVDEAKLPRAFLSADNDKIRAHMATVKANLTTGGTIIGGVRFYIDETPITN